MSLGCELFQGYFFAKPQLMKGRRAMPSFAAVLRIFQMMMADASHQRIAMALTSVPALIVQILRLANSGSQARSQPAPISSVKQALAVAGEKKVMQWCCLLLYANPDGLPVDEDPLARLAERRGFFMRRAAESCAPGSSDFQQEAFLTGMLSLLHVAHGIDADAFTGTLPVSDGIRTAIVEYRGRLGALLRIAELMERGQYEIARDKSDDVSPELGKQLLAICPV
jgi:EAL and modified HD-GYP domain-containing signal transduction protein